MGIWYILWSVWYILPVLVCCTKKNLATLAWTELESSRAIVEMGRAWARSSGPGFLLNKTQSPNWAWAQIEPDLFSKFFKPEKVKPDPPLDDCVFNPVNWGYIPLNTHGSWSPDIKASLTPENQVCWPITKFGHLADTAPANSDRRIYVLYT
jgi:hypothetical protein